MSQDAEALITEAVLKSLDRTPSPRTRQVSEALVRHLHAFIREVRPTQQEWEAGIGFLTRVGQTCTPVRQEFILLSDTLGVSMLVDCIQEAREQATATTILGPFYVCNPPERPLGADISGGAAGEPVVMEGRVLSEDGTPLEGAVVDTWHSDDDGFYDVQKSDSAEDFTMRARFHTDGEGRYHFRSIVPAAYPIPDDGPVGDMLKAQDRHPFRPAHVHFRIAAPGHRTLVTHIFLSDSDYLDSDVVFGVKQDLIATLERSGGAGDARLRYDFILPRGDAT